VKRVLGPPRSSPPRGGRRPPEARHPGSVRVKAAAPPVVEAGSTLRRLLRSLDGASFARYRQIAGRHAVGEFSVHVDHVPAGSFDGPAHVRVLLGRLSAGLAPDIGTGVAARIGVEDWLARRAVEVSERLGGARPGQPRIRIQEIGAAVVERSACRITPETIEIRFLVDLPAASGRISGAECERLLLEDLTRLSTAALACSSQSLSQARQAGRTVEEHRMLQSQLPGRGLVGFLQDGTTLRSASDGPALARPPLAAPESLAVRLDLPGGPVRGLGIPAGVTIVVGGAFQGKSALVDALTAGVQAHPHGHPWHGVVTLPDAVAIRQDPGRYVHGVDLSAFLDDTPWGTRTACFSAERASAVVSQAAGVAEALEVGARLLLVDEDRSAPRWLARDGRMQRLVPRAMDSITPFLDRARELYEVCGVSTVLATGAIGDFADVADTVVLLDGGRPVDRTLEAREIAAATRSARLFEALPSLRRPASRTPDPTTVETAGRVGGRVRGGRSVRVGPHSISLDAVDPITEAGQIAAIARCLEDLALRLGEERTVGEIVAAFDERFDREGLDAFAPPVAFDLSRPRRFEVAAALNRWRALRFVQRTKAEA